MNRMKGLVAVLLLTTIGAIGSLSGQTDKSNSIDQDAVPTVRQYIAPTENLFIAFPNPNASELLSIELDHAYIGTMSIQVYDVYGRLYYNKSIDKFDEYLEFDIDASGWTPGMYIVALIGSDVCGSQRVLKE